MKGDIEAVTAVLKRFLDPALAGKRDEMILALRPRYEDYAAAFLREPAEKARLIYEEMWAEPQTWPIKQEHTDVKVAAAWAEDFAKGDPRAQAFPGGWRDVAGLLRPGRLWFCWEFVGDPKGGGGLSFDGLCALERRWAWFPKPWRIRGKL